MKGRILKKILKNKRHPKHLATLRQVRAKMESYGRAQCVRLGLNPNTWASVTLQWPQAITRPMQYLQ